MKIKYYLIGVAVLMVIGLYTCEKVQHRNDINELKGTVAKKQTYIDSLEAAKTSVKVEIDTVVKFVTKWRYLSKAVDSIKIYEILDGRKLTTDVDWDDFATEPIIYEKLYLDTLRTDDFMLPYRISLWGDLRDVKFAEYILYDKTVTKEHIVKVPVNVPVEYKRSHLFLELGFNTQDFTKLHGVSGGFTYYNKHGWLLGVEYMRSQKINIYSAKIGIKIL